MKPGEISIKEISELLGISYIGENYIVDGLNLTNRDTSRSSIISYLASSKYIKYLAANTKVKALFLTNDIYNEISTDYCNISFFIVEKPEATFYNLHQHLFSSTDFYKNFDFPKRIGTNCEINETVIFEDGIIIGDNVTIGCNSVIKKGTVIKDNSTIGCGCIIGSEGFQLIKDSNGVNQLINHAGGCNISRNVYIGDNTTICKSLFEGGTLIGENSKIDNLVHIAHNCEIGRNCVITAGVILSGTTIIKDNVWVSPNSTILNRVILDNNSKVGIGSVVLRNVSSGSTVVGNPAKEI